MSKIVWRHQLVFRSNVIDSLESPDYDPDEALDQFLYDRMWCVRFSREELMVWSLPKRVVD